MFKDPKILFEVITKRSQTQGKRLMIDLNAFWDAYSINKTHDPKNPADSPTKIGKCHPLNHFLGIDKADFVADQFVLRQANSVVYTLKNSPVTKATFISSNILSSANAWVDLIGSTISNGNNQVLNQSRCQMSFSWNYRKKDAMCGIYAYSFQNLFPMDVCSQNSSLLYRRVTHCRQSSPIHCTVIVQS